MTQSEGAVPDTRFSLVAGGPFYLVLWRLGLLGADGLTTLRTATILAMLAWLPPALLAAAEALADGSDRGWGYFADLTVPARYMIAIWAMIAVESLSTTTRDAEPRSSSLRLSSLRPSSAEITRPPVSAAMSPRISLRRAASS